MKPTPEEIVVLAKQAKTVGLTLKYLPDTDFPTRPWCLKRERTGFSWRVQSVVQVMFHIGNENPRARALKAIARMNLRGQ